jgi:hypothetical protein
VLPIPDEPGERQRAVLNLPPAVVRPVHHRQPLAEHEHAREPAGFQQLGTTSGFEEGEPQQQVHARAERQRVRGEAIRQLVGRIGDDAGDPGRHRALEQEVDAALVLVGRAVVDQIGCHHMPPGSP